MNPLSFILVLFCSITYAQSDNEVGSLVKPGLEQSGEDTKSAPADDSGTPIGTGSSGPDKRARTPNEKADANNERILNHIAAKSGWYPNLKISVSNGMVIIEGRVKDSAQLEWLAKTADRLPTVIAVINKATVDQPPVSDFTPAVAEFSALLTKAKKALPLIGIALILVIFFFFVNQYVYAGVNSVWGRHVNNPFLQSTVTTISMIPIWAFMFYLVLQVAGLSGLAATIIGGTGALGLVLGFAFKDIAENYLSGLLLAIRSPFTKGDDVTVAGYDGYVQALNMRGTTVMGYDGTLVLIPNSLVMQSVIKNRTTNPRSRITFNVGIGFGENSSRAIELIYSSLSSVEGILKDPAPLAIVSELSSSTLVIQVRFWIDVAKSSMDKTKSKAIAVVKETLLKNEISIPDTAREVILTEPKLASAETDGQETGHNANTNHDEQVKKLGEGLDIMKPNADQHLIQQP